MYVNRNECPFKPAKANICQQRIRLQVSAYIIQHACRKAEDDRREGKTPQEASEKVSTKPLSFLDAIPVDHSKRTYSTSLSSGSKHTKYSDTANRVKRRSSRKDHVIRQTLVKRHKTTVAVVISARKFQDIKAAGIASERRKGIEPHGKTNTAHHSARGQRKNKPRAHHQP
jgi:hypothetical protein